MATTDQIMATARESLEFWRPLVRLPDIHPWALLGSEDGETSFLPHAIGDHGEAYGISQWHAQRADVLALPPPKGCGIDVRIASHLDQLRAMHFEMTSVDGYRHVWDHLMAAETIQDAVTVLVREYEHSAQQARDITRRTGLAMVWMGQLG